MDKKSSTGKEKVIIGVTGFLLGALGITVWNNREKIKETATSAKERAVELKIKTTNLADTVKEKFMILKNSHEQNREYNFKKIFLNTSNEVESDSIVVTEENKPYIKSLDDNKSEHVNEFFKTFHNFLDDWQKKMDDKKE